MQIEQNEVKAKLAAEKQYLASKNAGQVQGIGYAQDMCNERQESTQERLLRRLRAANSDSDKLNRALTILNAHPEFEDLVWLLQSGLV